MCPLFGDSTVFMSTFGMNLNFYLVVPQVFPDQISAKPDSQALEHNNKAIKRDNYCEIDTFPSLSTNEEQQNVKKLKIVGQTIPFNKIESYYKYR